MFYVILIILNFSLSVYSEKNTQFLINVTKLQYFSSEFDVPDILMPIVAQNQPLNIIFINYNDTENVSCQRKSESYLFPITFEKTYIDNQKCLIIKVKSITTDMSTKWECDVLKDILKNKHQIITFKIHVKGAKPVVMTINDKIFKHELTDMSVRHSDGFGMYWFEPGEAVDVSCTDPDGNARLVLQHEDGEGTKNISSKRISSRNSVFYTSILTEENDNDVVDCSYISKDEMIYTYRTMFMKKYKNSPDSPYEISINNMQLAPIDKSENKYHYKYYDDEDVELICKNKNRNASGEIIFGQDGTPLIPSLNVKVIEETPWKKTMKFKANHFKNIHVNCYDTNNTQDRNADILFMPNTREPHISGLSPRDLRYQYSNNDTSWFAHYWYSNNQTINLKCVTKQYGAELILKIDNTIVDRTEKENHINHKIFLTNDYNGKSIVCTSRKGLNSIQRAVIIFHERNISPGFPHDDDQINILIIGGCVIGVLLTLAVICVMFQCRTKRRNDTKIPCKNETQDLQISKPDSRKENQKNCTDSSQKLHPENCTNSSQKTHLVNCTDSEVMVENTLYNSPIYAIPKKKETEYHYIELDDDIIKKKKDLHKNNITKDQDKNKKKENVDYVQPYASSIMKTNNYECSYVNNTNNKKIELFNNSEKDEYVEPAYSEINRR